jgi:hypothetical protein
LEGALYPDQLWMPMPGGWQASRLFAKSFFGPRGKMVAVAPFEANGTERISERFMR